jgi:hypothetical protein
VRRFWPAPGVPDPITHQGFMFLAEMAVLDGPGVAARPRWSLWVCHPEGEDPRRRPPARLSLGVGFEVASRIGHPPDGTDFLESTPQKHGVARSRKARHGLVFAAHARTFPAGQRAGPASGAAPGSSGGPSGVGGERGRGGNGREIETPPEPEGPIDVSRRPYGERGASCQAGDQRSSMRAPVVRREDEVSSLPARGIGQMSWQKGGSMLGTLALLAQEANEGATDTILWIIAAVLVVAGIVAIVRGGVLWGIILIVAGLLVGPGGVSLFD